MKAVVLQGSGGVEVLTLVDRPDPAFGPDEVRVRVRATALNRADLLQRRGLYPAPFDSSPDIPGLEYAGEVEACGERVTTLRCGDRVMGIVAGGAHAEKVVADARACIPVPEHLSWEEAAAIPEAFLTAFDALTLQAGLSIGESVLIPAAASGVGTAAVQLVALAGATPIALSRTQAKRTRLEAMGAQEVLDPAGGEIVARIRKATRDRGVDVILELVGASSWPLDMEVIAQRGRIVLVGTLGGAAVAADLGLIMRKRLTLIGTVLRSRAIEEKIALAGAFTRQVLPHFEVRRLKPVVDRVLPLASVAAAHEALERGDAFGKIVLRMDA